jgi:hypothetical protein
LAEAEMLSQVIENSNLPVANDSISPIHGGSDFSASEKLQRRRKFKNETIPDHHGQLRYSAKPNT